MNRKNIIFWLMSFIFLFQTAIGQTTQEDWNLTGNNWRIFTPTPVHANNNNPADYSDQLILFRTVDGNDAIENSAVSPEFYKGNTDKVIIHIAYNEFFTDKGFDLTVKGIRNGEFVLLWTAKNKGKVLWIWNVIELDISNLDEPTRLSVSYVDTTIDGTGEADMIAIDVGLAEELFNNITSVESVNDLPSEYYLWQNYPNPFNPETKIRYSIPKTGFVSLKVYDMLGREVATLVNEIKNRGNHEVFFDAKNLPSSSYFYTFNTGSKTMTKKMLLVK